jgi:hypothetical protein
LWFVPALSSADRQTPEGYLQTWHFSYVRAYVNLDTDSVPFAPKFANADSVAPKHCQGAEKDPANPL